MAEPTHIGTVTVWGIDGTVAYSGLASTENLPETVSLEDGTDEHESKDAKGEVVGLKLFNPVARATVKVYPSKAAGTGAIAAARANIILPVKGAKVTLAGFHANSGLNSSAWIYAGGGSQEYNNVGEVALNLPLRKYNTDIAATANT